MKKLDDKQKIQVIETIIETTIKVVEPDCLIESLGSALKTYLNSDDYIQHSKGEERTSIILSFGLVMDMLSSLHSCYYE